MDEKPWKKYARVIDQQHISKELLRKLALHDAEVLDSYVGNDRLCLRMEDVGTEGFCDLVLINPRIQVQEQDLVGCLWLYVELYRINDGFELHVLFWTGQDGANQRLAELSVKCDEIMIE